MYPQQGERPSAGPPLLVKAASQCRVRSFAGVQASLGSLSARTPIFQKPAFAMPARSYYSPTRIPRRSATRTASATTAPAVTDKG